MKIKEKDILTGSIRMTASGHGFFTNEDLEDDLFVYKNNTNQALHLDTVEVEVIRGKKDRFEGVVKDIVERFKTTYVGTLEIGDDFAFLVPDNHKVHVDFYVPLTELNGGQNGQKAVVELTEWKDKAKNPNGKILSVLGEAGDNDAEIHSILHEYDLPYMFPENVINEADAITFDISQEEIDKRRDMRDVLTFTIDPETARDFDDALSVRWVSGKIEVGVHIADVSHYLRPDTELDKEAYKRATSVYLVDRCVPMLPEHLSNGVCSLRPNEDKLCFSAIFTLDHNGAIENEWFGRTVIHSDHRFTYEEAQECIESDVMPHPGFYDPRIYDEIRNLDKYAKKIREMRFKKGAISFDKNEVGFVLDENKKPVDIKFKVSKDSNKLIEEFMLLANKRVSKFIGDKRLPFVYRIHDEPNPEKLSELREFIKQFGYSLNIGTPQEIRSSLNKLLKDIQGKPEQNMIENLAVRTMQKAVYTTDNIGHYGLGFEDYSHFTSPIRRYPDVMVHRLLARYLDGKANVKQTKLEARCEHCSQRERKAQKASRASIKYKQAEFMQTRIGKVYEGVVSSVMDYGIFVEIPENGCDCLARFNDIEGVWSPDHDNHQIKEFNTGETIRLGDIVTVIIKSVNLEKKSIDVSLIRM